jgi:hypothetical protein
MIPAATEPGERAVKERPILFSGSMVRAILAGTKTQTRRIARLPEYDGDTDVDGWPLVPARTSGCLVRATCRYGAAGDRLWCRETWSNSALSMYPCPPCWFRADFSKYEDPAGRREHDAHCDGNRADCWRCIADTDGEFRWRPSIHMPRWASRLTLEVTGVRVERLADITAADAVAEGVVDPAHGWDGNVTYPLARFRDLWDQINGSKAPFASSPWVWVIEFRRLS